MTGSVTLAPMTDKPIAKPIAVIVGASVAALATFLPWVSLGAFSKSGIDGDGAFSLGAAIVVLALALLNIAGELRWVTVLGGLIILATAGADWIDIGHRVAKLHEAGNPYADAIKAGAGLYLAAAGGLTVVIGAAFAEASKK